MGRMRAWLAGAKLAVAAVVSVSTQGEPFELVIRGRSMRDAMAVRRWTGQSMHCQPFAVVGDHAL